MLLRLNETIKRHLSDNIFSYAVIIFFFILGISFGAMTVNNMNIDTKSEVKEYIDGFISISRTDSIQSADILKQSIKFNLLSAGALFLAGLTYVGIIVTPIIAGFRGFCIGFTVAFLTDSLGKGGFLLALVSILPQNIVYIPLLIILCVCSISLSLAVLRNKLNRKHGEMPAFIWSFALSVLFLFFIMIGGSVVEAYLTPFLVKLVAPYLI